MIVYLKIRVNPAQESELMQQGKVTKTTKKALYGVWNLQNSPSKHFDH